MSCLWSCARDWAEGWDVPVETDFFVLISREDIPPSVGLPEGMFPKGEVLGSGGVPIEGNELLTSQEDIPPSNKLPEGGGVSESDEFVLTSEEDIPLIGRLPEGEVPSSGGFPAERDELVLTSREELPDGGGLPEGEVPGGGNSPEDLPLRGVPTRGGVSLGGDIFNK